jgi:hypothetical protein
VERRQRRWARRSLPSGANLKSTPGGVFRQRSSDMDTKHQVNKLWKDLQDSAREFASFGLQSATKALDFTTSTLTTLKDDLNKTAERLATKDGEGGSTAEGSQPPTNQ